MTSPARRRHPWFTALARSAARQLGHAVALGTCAVGVVLACFLLGPAPVVLLSLITGVAGGAGRWVARQSTDTEPVPLTWRQVAGTSLAVPAIVLAALGLGDLAGWSGVALLLIAMAACPVVHGPLVRRLRRTTHPDIDLARLELLVHPPVDTLSADQLCSGWSSTFLALREAGDPDLVAQLCDLREQYLDEFERRFPSDFDTWMERHAQPGADPRTHLLRGDAA